MLDHVYMDMGTIYGYRLTDYCQSATLIKWLTRYQHSPHALHRTQRLVRQIVAVLETMTLTNRVRYGN